MSRVHSEIMPPDSTGYCIVVEDEVQIIVFYDGDIMFDDLVGDANCRLTSSELIELGDQLKLAGYWLAKKAKEGNE